MGESSTNILNLSESALNLLKKSDLVQKILDLKRKVVVDADLHQLCENIKRLTESMNQIVTENKKLQSDIVIVKNVKNTHREKAWSNKTTTLSKSKILKLKQNFQKNKVVTGKTLFFVIGPFCTHHSICLNIGFCYISFV